MVSVEKHSDSPMNRNEWKSYCQIPMSFTEVVHILDFYEGVEFVAQAHLEILGLSHPPASDRE